MQKVDEPQWVGKTLAEVCQKLGNPDLVKPASHYSAIFSDASPSVVLTYRSLGHRWYLNEDATVAGVIPIKE